MPIVPSGRCENGGDDEHAKVAAMPPPLRGWTVRVDSLGQGADVRGRAVEDKRGELEIYRDCRLRELESYSSAEMNVLMLLSRPSTLGKGCCRVLASVRCWG
jgi:hypothetical protein